MSFYRRLPAALTLFLSLGGALHAQNDTTAVAVQAASHTVDESRMNKGLVTSGIGALSGQSAGVTVSSGANPAAMLSAVRVRGTTSLTGGNDPLVIIDGVASDLSTLGTLYPGDIERFNILKDASETAQYGSRGASGVIEVTTKKGRGGAFSLRYDGTAGVEAVSRNLRMLSADGFRRLNRSLGRSFPDMGMDSDMPGSILRLGGVQNHHIAFGGGTDESRYRASLGVLDHSTVVRTNAFKNYTAKLDVSQQAFGGFVSFDLGIFGSLLRSSDLHDMQHLFYSSAAFNPTFPEGPSADGSYPQIPSASQINHPASLLEKQDDADNAHFNTHLQAKLHLAPSLSLSLFGSYSYNVISDAHYFPTIVWSHGEAYRGEDRSQDMLASANLAYARQLGDHRLDARLLAEVQQVRADGFCVTTTNFSTDALGYNAIQAGAARLWDGTLSWFEQTRMLSFLTGADYSFADRYFISASMRADASSKFGPNHRWGFFPSVSLSWDVLREPFFRAPAWLSGLKLKAGYGLSGNQDALGAYNSLELVEPSGIIGYEGVPTTTFGIVRNANPDLKWEVRSSMNYGLESAFLDGRIVFTAEYYRSLTRDMLYEYEVSVPPFAYNRLVANLGRMSNQGLELGLGCTPLQREETQLNVNVNLAFQRNRLVSLGGWYRGEYLDAPEVAGINALNGAGFHGGHNDVVYQIVGQPLGVFYLPHCTGLQRGDDGFYRYMIEDISGDGVLDDGVDRYIAGQATPKAMLGSNVSFRWREWDITVQVNGAFGHKIFNGTSLTYMNLGSLPYYNVLEEAPERMIADQTVTDYWLEKGDYLNVDYVTLGWNVPVRIPAIQHLRVSASVNNLCTLTGYSGLTPMINSTVVNSTFGLDDKVSFPVYRSFTLGLSIQF